MSNQENKSKEIAIVIADHEFTFDEAAIMAFRIYMYNNFHFDMSYINWTRLLLDPEFKRKDYGFLLLYYLDKIADDEIKKLCQEDLEIVKKEINR